MTCWFITLKDDRVLLKVKPLMFEVTVNVVAVSFIDCTDIEGGVLGWRFLRLTLDRDVLVQSLDLCHVFAQCPSPPWLVRMETLSSVSRDLWRTAYSKLTLSVEASNQRIRCKIYLLTPNLFFWYALACKASVLVRGFFFFRPCFRLDYQPLSRHERAAEIEPTPAWSIVLLALRFVRPECGKGFS